MAHRKNGKKQRGSEIPTSNISSPIRSPPFLWAAPFGLRPQMNTAIRFLSLCPAREIPKPRRSFSRVTINTLCPRFWYLFWTFSAKLKRRSHVWWGTIGRDINQWVSSETHTLDFTYFRTILERHNLVIFHIDHTDWLIDRIHNKIYY